MSNVESIRLKYKGNIKALSDVHKYRIGLTGAGTDMVFDRITDKRFKDTGEIYVENHASTSINKNENITGWVLLYTSGLINRQILVVRGKQRMKKSEVGKRHVCLSSAGAQGASNLFFLSLSHLQPHYHVKISSVIYIDLNKEGGTREGIDLKPE
ncbi:hypothetical protein P9597_05380 [Aneurinibacillus migulanus]|uniref:hypothetical protein n=1 Tax=Aneurinibacillus migulanus TaxID=47500 RepID=UPI002E23DBCA|nr:hypothetical protein [Aneurinibacillus migulanus]